MSDERLPKVWDKEAIYDAEFSPVVRQLTTLATKHNMPLVLTVMYADTGEDDGSGVNVCSSVVMPAGTPRVIQAMVSFMRRHMGLPS